MRQLEDFIPAGHPLRVIRKTVKAPLGQRDTLFCGIYEADMKGQGRSNETHASTTDADTRMYYKGDNASRMRFMGHTLSDNRHGLIASAQVITADGYAEREAAKVMINDSRQAVARSSAEIAASEGYNVSIQNRRLIEQGFGWAKTMGRMRQVKVSGIEQVDQMFVLTTAAYNLMRMRYLG